MNFAVTGDIRTTDLRKMLQHGLSVWSGTGEQQEHAHYCLVTLTAFHIYEQGSTCDWATERTDFPSCDPAQTQLCLERQEYSEHYIFARPVPACWWMHSTAAVFQEKETGTGLEDQPASFSVLQAPEAGEHVLPHLCAGAFPGAGPQQSRGSTVMPPIFKINF